MEDENLGEKKEFSQEDVFGEQDFVAKLLEHLGINIDGIDKKIEAVMVAKMANDPEALLTALHELLAALKGATTSAAPEIKKFKDEAAGVIVPIIDVLLKDSAVDIYAYIENARAEAAQKAIEAHRKMNEIEADLIVDQIKYYRSKGISKKDAIELVKTKLSRPQYISLSFPTSNITTVSGASAKKSKQEILRDFMQLASEDPEVMNKLLEDATNMLIRGFPGKFTG